METAFNYTDKSDGFWIDWVVSKVRNSDRREFLRNHFIEDTEKFYRLMRSRNHLLEFTNGTLPDKLPGLTEDYKESLVEDCVGGCGLSIPPWFTPWGEHIPRIPICTGCLKQFNKTKGQNMSSEMDNHITKIQTHRDSITKEIEGLKAVLIEKLQQAVTSFNVLTSQHVGLTKEDLLADKSIANALAAFTTGTTIKRRGRPAGATVKTPNPSPLHHQYGIHR